MTARADFICSENEEREFFQHLAKTGATQVYDVNGRALSVRTFSPDALPAWHLPLHIYIHRPDLGPLVWHESAPSATGSSHGELVSNFLAREAWLTRGLGDADRLLNLERSPIVCYHRGVRTEGRMGPNVLLAPPSVPSLVGLEYEKWVKRLMSWIRRRGELIHDYRKPSKLLPNPHSTLNSVYALPEILEDVRSSPGQFTLLSQTGA